MTFSVKDLNQKLTPWQKTSSADFQRPMVPSCYGGASRQRFVTMDLDQSILNQWCLTWDLQKFTVQSQVRQVECIHVLHLD